MGHPMVGVTLQAIQVMQDLVPCLVARSRFFNSARAPSCVSTMAFPSLLGCTILHFGKEEDDHFQWGKGKKCDRLKVEGLEKFITHNGGFFPTLKTFESLPSHTFPHYIILYPSISQEKWRIPQLGSVETFRSNSELDFLRMISDDAAIYWDLLSAPREHVALKLQILTEGVQPLQHGQTKRGSKQQQRENSRYFKINRHQGSFDNTKFARKLIQYLLQ